MPAKRSVRKAADPESEEPTTWVGQMNQAIDELSETRTSTREEALETLVNSFSCHYVPSHIEGRVEEVLALLKRSLVKNNSTKEACLAARGIALVFVNLDTSESDLDDYYRRLLTNFRNIIKDSEEIEIKLVCLQTLGLISYIAASDIDKQLVREYLFDLIETDGAEFNTEVLDSQDCDRLFAEALRAYGVLFASSFTQGMVTFEVLWEEIEKVMPIHEMLLESNDKDVRIATGENIALMFEAANIFTQDDDDDDDEDGFDKPEYDNMDGLIHTLKDLSVDSNRRRNKSDRAEQKSVFRDILKSVEENIKPVEELKIGGRTLSFRGWAKILALNSFRKTISQGLQHHLKVNRMLQYMFHFSSSYSSRQQQDSDDSDQDDIDTAGLSNVDRRYIYDENKKSRTKQIRHARIGKENQTY
ncbi:IFRD-domain-containing protein [Backusella circina FSU 941]|nr:IFRD-domain-containing protein [Backusella circina FSU 941]